MLKFLRRMQVKIREAHMTGDLYIGVALTGLVGTGVALWGMDQISLQRRKFANEIGTLMATDQRKELIEQAETERRWAEAEPLWRGTITQAVSVLDGKKMLKSARVGVAVDVLEEDVGDGGAYLMVRTADTGALGWYPKLWIRDRL